MKKIELEIPEGKKAKWVGGILTLVDEHPKNVMESVKTFEDACRLLGENHPMVAEWNEIKMCEHIGKDTVSYMKLRIITAALNEGWEPAFTDEEKRWFPYFILYTKEEIDSLSEEDKARVVFRSDYYANTSGGVSYAYAYYASAYVSASYGCRLAFKTEELAKYAGEQFIDLYLDFCLTHHDGN